MRTYSLIVFGNSIMWGQGLLEEHKFHSMIAAHIQKILTFF